MAYSVYCYSICGAGKHKLCAYATIVWALAARWKNTNKEIHTHTQLTLAWINYQFINSSVWLTVGIFTSPENRRNKKREHALSSKFVAQTTTFFLSQTGSIEYATTSRLIKSVSVALPACLSKLILHIWISFASDFIPVIPWNGFISAQYTNIKHSYT